MCCHKPPHYVVLNPSPAQGLEVIEAHYLFGSGYDDIDIVIHPQSIIHSMVETADSSVLAQVDPNLRTPLPPFKSMEALSLSACLFSGLTFVSCLHVLFKILWLLTLSPVCQLSEAASTCGQTSIQSQINKLLYKSFLYEFRALQQPYSETLHFQNKAISWLQLGWPSMKLPILVTMAWPERAPCSEQTWPRLDFIKAILCSSFAWFLLMLWPAVAFLCAQSIISEAEMGYAAKYMSLLLVVHG